MILEGLRGVLLAAPAVAAVHVDETPQGERADHVLLYDADDDFNPCLDGTDDSLVTTQVDAACKASTRAKAEDLAAAVVARLADYRGPMGGRRCRAVLLGGVKTAQEDPPEGRQTGRFVAIVELTVQHSPA